MAALHKTITCDGCGESWCSAHPPDDWDICCVCGAVLCVMCGIASCNDCVRAICPKHTMIAPDEEEYCESCAPIGSVASMREG